MFSSRDALGADFFLDALSPPTSFFLSKLRLERLSNEIMERALKLGNILVQVSIEYPRTTKELKEVEVVGS